MISWAVERQYEPDDLYVWEFKKLSEAWQMFKACKQSGYSSVKLRLCFKISFSFWSWHERS